MASALQRVVRLECPSQNYAWGKVGRDSLVAQLTAANGVAIDEGQPYAELWMGTHPNAPARLWNGDMAQTGELLTDYLQRHGPANLLGQDVCARFDGALPFLFKVLSVAKALSIQAHPDKALAERLHRDFPDRYKDPNHKPEMAVALTRFEALCGFRDLSTILRFCQQFPPLGALVGSEHQRMLEQAVALATSAADAAQHHAFSKQALRGVFHHLMTRSAEAVTSCLQQLLAIPTLESPQMSASDTDLFHLLARLNDQFPGDVGCLCVFFLNYLTLNPGQALFLGANEPHAYLSGDIIECMATSDNVVRAGLTPKFKDVEVLVEMLTYDYGEAQNRILNGTNWDQFTTITRFDDDQGTHEGQDQTSADDAPKVQQGLSICVYDPPIPEFAVARIVVTTPQLSHALKPVAGPSVLLIIQGHGHLMVPDDHHTVSLQPGHVFFIAADTALTIQQDTQSPDELMCYRAFCTIA
ncbi:hypothetical protein H4R35_006642 [Dimargaris xerosporica]|nr:hypothetical protein H4R35_006642 [Dimargaris xerosporica]